MRFFILGCCALFAVANCPRWLHAQDKPVFVVIRAGRLEDKIRGGMLGQILGNLNGLPHEFKYIDEPGNVERYTPSLPDGAFTDDDTDIEWVYISEIARGEVSRLPPGRLVNLWKRHVNRRIWAANRYARDLMELGLEPPWTGNIAANPFAEFNISGQFICESFGLMSPAMPQTAARLGLNYTHVTIDGEPAQTTQLFTAMIATAFVDDNIAHILDAGMKAVDPSSRVARVVSEVRTICHEHTDNWRAARAEIKERWQTHGGGVRDRNGYELNTASTVAALIYGRKDFVETLRMAFNFGWDADNNAATAATIVGVIKGRRWMNQQGWNIKDVYRNTTRDDMPTDETLSGLESKLIKCARLVIREQGGGLVNRQGKRVYRIRREQPANVEPLFTEEQQRAGFRAEFAPRLEKELTADGVARARAAYVALCLGEAERLKEEKPAEWSAAVAELEKHPAIVKQIYTTTAPAGQHLRDAAARAGVKAPAGK
jgi:ADP-ribosylglycohydrolase